MRKPFPQLYGAGNSLGFCALQPPSGQLHLPDTPETSEVGAPSSCEPGPLGAAGKPIGPSRKQEFKCIKCNTQISRDDNCVKVQWVSEHFKHQ